MLNYLVIGASSGIGYALTQQLSSSGNKVYGTYSKNKIESDIELVEYHQVDVLDENTALDFLPDVLHGIVYCPGSILLKPFERLRSTDFENDYKLNVCGAVKAIQSAMPNLKKAEKASIVLFSTVAVQTGLNFHSLVASSKGAVEGLTRALAAEYAPKIRVNCIAPSLTNTPMAATLLNTEQKAEANAMRHPLKRIGTPADIAEMAAFLLSEKAGWISGQIFHVDGGMSALRT